MISIAEKRRNARIMKQIDDWTAKKIAEGPEACLRYLIELGTHDKDGNITPEYGGDPVT